MTALYDNIMSQFVNSMCKTFIKFAYDIITISGHRSAPYIRITLGLVNCIQCRYFMYTIEVYSMNIKHRLQ
jgi:hypothetical protein